MRNRQTCGVVAITLQVVSQTIGPNLLDLHCRHVTLPHFQDGIPNSPKRHISSFEREALLLKSCKIHPASSSSICCFRSVSNPLRLKFLRTPYRKKEKLCQMLLSFDLSSVLLTKFGLSVSSVWSSGLIEKTHHNEMTVWFPKGR